MFPSHLSLISLNFYFSFCSFRWCFRFSCSIFYECFSAHPSLPTHTISRLFLCRFTWLHWLKRCISGWNILDKKDTLKKNNQIKTTIKLKEIEKNKSPNSDTRDILLTSSSTTPPLPPLSVAHRSSTSNCIDSMKWKFVMEKCYLICAFIFIFWWETSVVSTVCHRAHFSGDNII